MATTTTITRRRSSGERGLLGKIGGMTKGPIGNVLAGVMAGAGARYGTQYMGAAGAPVAFGITGFLTGNETLLTLAGISAAGMIPLPGATSTPSGGWV